MNLLSRAVNIAFELEAKSTRSSITTIVSTVSRTSPFATWLACKFGLDDAEFYAEMDTTSVDVSVVMVDSDTSASHSVIQSRETFRDHD